MPSNNQQNKNNKFSQIYVWIESTFELKDVNNIFSHMKVNTKQLQQPQILQAIKMHQFGKRTFFGTHISLSPLSKHRKKQADEKQKGEELKQNKLVAKCEKTLVNSKKRTLSLSKLASIQKQQTYPQKKSKQASQDELVYSLTDRVVFQKLNMHSMPIQKQTPKTRRQRIERNHINESQTPCRQQISLLKMILRKKEEDLILLKQKQQQYLNQKLKLNNNDKDPLQQHYPSNNAIKRIKLLKKTKQYEYYDNLVSNLLNSINNNAHSVTNVNANVIENQGQMVHGSTIVQNVRAVKALTSKKFRSSSMSTLNELDPDKFNSTCGNNFGLILAKKNSLALEKKKESMFFGMANGTGDSIYEKKITSFVEFLYKVNFSNSIYVDLSLSSHSRRNLNNRKTCKVYVGNGNNSELVKSVIKRRFWLQLTANKNQSNLIWTQDTQKDFHQKQLQQKQSQMYSSQQYDGTTTKKPTFSLKHKFTKPQYSLEANKKILHSSQIDQADACYSRSYMGLKSSHPQVSIKLITNHIPNNSIIGSKKILFKLMHWYYSEIERIDPFTYLPHTYHIIPGDKDNLGIKKFKEEQLEKTQRIWIVKPGENTNRGIGISVATTMEIQRLMRYKKFHKNGEPKTYIVQKYLKPFLYNQRKFDIRHYLLITSVNGFIKGYWYKSGYIRTSSEKFDMDELDNEYIHLTNDAIQKNSENYGKYEEGNKLSYSTFQRYLDNTIPHKKYDFNKQILEEMKKITKNVMKAGFMFLDPQRNQRLSKGNGCNFQLYGMDFMIDHKFKPYLIEINANPCLQISCPLLERLIPITLQHTLRLALDPLIPPPQHYGPSKRYQLSDKALQRMRFELIFDEKHQGRQLIQKFNLCENKFQLNGIQLEPEQDLFEDDGVEIKDDTLFQEIKE